MYDMQSTTEIAAQHIQGLNDPAQTCLGLQAKRPHLCLTHVTLQKIIVHDNGGVLDVEVAGNPPQLSDIQISTLLIKSCHLALLQLMRCITD